MSDAEARDWITVAEIWNKNLLFPRENRPPKLSRTDLDRDVNEEIYEPIAPLPRRRANQQIGEVNQGFRYDQEPEDTNQQSGHCSVNDSFYQSADNPNYGLDPYWDEAHDLDWEDLEEIRSRINWGYDS